MDPLQAAISFTPSSQGRRRSARRTLRLGIAVSSSQDWTKALIHDLSETGLMIETAAELVEGETILCDLPVAGSTEAQIIWNWQNYYGCEFLTPITKAAVSAAVLQTSFAPFDPAAQPRVEDVPVGVNPSVDELAAWKSEFERTKGASGYRLLGFRQTSDGLIIAIVAKTN
jgi:hypothetical protein